MKAVKIAAIVLAVFVALIGGCIALVFGATKGLPIAADAFFSKIAAGNIQEAYESTAQEFKAATSQDEFAAFLSQSALADYQKGHWGERSIENNRGKLKGTARTRAGGEIPITLEFVKENGVWKILTVRKAAAGLQPEESAAPPTAPSEAELTALTRSAIELFAESVYKDDFAIFHRGIGPTWRRQYTAEQLRNAFAVFVENKIDLRPLLGMNPSFSRPAEMDGDGVLTVEGMYASDPVVSFRLKFFKEEGRWQLLGFNLKM